MSKEKPIETMELVPKGTQTMARPAEFDVESIFRYAIEHQGTAEVMEKLMGIRRELNAEKAKMAFDGALAAFQAECPIIKKTVSGAKNAYRYAPLDDIILQTRELLLKHGFSFSVSSEVEKDWVKAICTITHRAGHSHASEFKVPVDNRNTMMTDPQRYAGSMTFTKRYAFCNALGILTADEDKDAAGAAKQSSSGKVATDATRKWFLEQTKDIHVKLQAYGIDSGLIMPDAGLEDWPLANVPTSKSELTELKKKVEAIL